MFKIIGADHKEYGPVTAEQVRQWIAEGRANAQTLMQDEGNTGWKPLSTFPEFAAKLKLTAPPPPRIAFGVAAALVGIPTDLVSRASLDIGACLSRSWQLIRTHMGILVGTTVLVLLIEFGSELVPVIGTVVSIVIGGPLCAGLIMLYLKLIREEPTGLNDVFAGFGGAFVQLMLGGIVLLVLVGLSGFVCITACLFLFVFSRIIPHSVALLIAAVGSLPAIYLGVSWIFVLPLMIDKRLEFWPAMELSRKTVGQQWWSVLGLILLASLVAVAGFALCLVGELVTIPIFCGALTYAYEDTFGAISEQAS